MAFGSKHKERPAESGMTIIAAGSRLAGDLVLQNTLHIDGALQGTVTSSSNISIGTSGAFVGTIKAKHVLVCGTVEGDLDCDCIEITQTGSVTGDLVCRELVVESGARFSGHSQPRDSVAGERLPILAAEPADEPAEPAMQVGPIREEPDLERPTRVEPILLEPEPVAAAEAPPADGDPEAPAPEPLARNRRRLGRQRALSDYR